jgi:PAS domain S-box-containing protein
VTLRTRAPPSTKVEKAACRYKTGPSRIAGSAGFQALMAARPVAKPPMTTRKTLDRIANGGTPIGAPTLPLGEPEQTLLEGYRTLVERIPGIVYTAEAGEAGQWLYASPQIHWILGYTALEWCADATLWFRCLHPADRERALADEIRSRETGDPLNSEYRMIARDGSVIWFHDQATPVPGEDGRGTVLQGVMLDITDRKLAEARVRESRGQLAEAQRLAQMGSWEMDLLTHAVTLSDEVYRICGVNPGDFGDDFENGIQLIHPDDRPMVEHTFGEVTKNPRRFEYQIKILRPDGEVRTIENHGDVVRDDDGRPVRMVGTVQDITERKRAEGALRQSHEQFQSIIDNSPSVIYAKDRAFKYLFANREFGRMFQVEPSATIGGTDETIMPLDVAGRARASDRKVLEGGEVVQEEEVIWRRGGDRTYLTQKFPLLDPDGEIYAVCAISTDITERKVREEELRAEVDWSIRVREAVRESKLVLHAQPIIDLITNTVHQEELLVRMKGDRGGFEDLVMPGEFLPPAERFGLVQEIDRWVVTESMKIAKHRRVEVNISGRSIGDAELIKLIETELQKSGADPANLIFEITETAAADNLEAARDFAWRLRGLGCGFALDDFGTGYGTFAYLKHLPVTYLKIDIEFVRFLAIDPSDQKIVKSIIAVAQNFGVQTIAEGVEHQTTLDLLRDLGVDYAQGFLIGEPKPVEYMPSY